MLQRDFPVVADTIFSVHCRTDLPAVGQNLIFGGCGIKMVNMILSLRIHSFHLSDLLSFS